MLTQPIYRSVQVHVRKIPLAPDVELKTVARGTPGFSGAEPL
jgi:cell division protease FtsH